MGGVSALPLPPLLSWKSSSRLGGFRPSWLVGAALAKLLRPPAGKRLNPKFAVFSSLPPASTRHLRASAASFAWKLVNCVQVEKRDEKNKRRALEERKVNDVCVFGPDGEKNDRGQQ